MSPTSQLHKAALALLATTLIAGVGGCGSDETTSASATDDASVDSGTEDSSVNADTSADAASETEVPDVTTEPDASDPVADPAKDGPYTYEEFDGTAGSNAAHCAIPTAGPSKAPYPIVLFAHGFMIENTRYYDYLKHLGSFGYVACTVGYNSLGSQDADSEAIVDTLDWAIAESTKPSGKLSGKVNSSMAGVAGHSRGGKAAVNAAAKDSRFLAVLGLDPVNTCPLGTCPNGIEAMAKLSIPSGFLGETTDNGSAGGLGQACAPAADNFEQFYKAATSSSFQVTIVGANHMSFVDDVGGCLACSACKTATADRPTVSQLVHAYTVAFFERRLRGLTAYDTYLTGPMATQNYVQTGLAKIESK